MVVFTWADTNHTTYIIFEKYKQKIIKYAVNNKEQFKQKRRKKDDKLKYLMIWAGLAWIQHL